MSIVTDTMIANRALQRVGVQRIGALVADDTVWTEDSKNASEIRACYHMLRRAELNRNVWRFSIRTVALRAIGKNSKLVTFAAYNNATTYALGAVSLATDGQLYQSRIPANVGNDPTLSAAQWSLYFGSAIAQEYVTTFSTAITYAQYDHTVGSDGVVYYSLADGNINHNPVGDAGVHWTPTTWNIQPSSANGGTSFYAGELVFVGNNLYISLRGDNLDTPPSSRWLALAGSTVAYLNFMYPIGSGPNTEQTSRNVYQLPNGFMRIAPQDPKAGAYSFLGAPGNNIYRDWNFQDDYFTTCDTGIILFRFAADIQDPTQFNPLFAEGFASRIAFEICEPLTQSTTKLSGIASEYKQFMGEARTVNGIETGPTEPPLDDYLTCRY
jgi:hypothetical protein